MWTRLFTTIMKKYNCNSEGTNKSVTTISVLWPRGTMEPRGARVGVLGQRGSQNLATQKPCNAKTWLSACVCVCTCVYICMNLICRLARLCVRARVCACERICACESKCEYEVPEFGNTVASAYLWNFLLQLFLAQKRIPQWGGGGGGRRSCNMFGRDKEFPGLSQETISYKPNMLKDALPYRHNPEVYTSRHVEQGFILLYI